MCGRFTLATNAEEVEYWFELSQSVPEFQASYNIPPASDVPVIWQLPDNGRACSLMHWGLIPHWAKSTTTKYKMINARAETLAEKPAYRDAYRKRRCLIPNTGFYEWYATASGKQPWYIGHADHSLFAFAGLWEYWEGEHSLYSFSIVTTVANQAMGKIHERMPVILEKSDYDRWLDPAMPQNQLDDMLIPREFDWLTLYPVSRDVNSPHHDHSGLMEPVSVNEPNQK